MTGLENKTYTKEVIMKIHPIRKTTLSAEILSGLDAEGQTP
jgi:hypothetical protein